VPEIVHRVGVLTIQLNTCGYKVSRSRALNDVRCSCSILFSTHFCSRATCSAARRRAHDAAEQVWLQGLPLPRPRRRALPLLDITISCLTLKCFGSLRTMFCSLHHAICGGVGVAEILHRTGVFTTKLNSCGYKGAFTVSRVNAASAVCAPLVH
jgi:hypothetical protein